MATGDVTITSYGDETLQAFACGSIESDIDVDINVYCGFQPRRVELYLVDAGNTAHSVNIWNMGMAASTTLMIADAGDLSFPTTLGPVVLSDTTGEGFTVPAGQTGAADDDVVYWVAWR